MLGRGKVLRGERPKTCRKPGGGIRDIQDVASPTVGQEMGSSLHKRKVTVPVVMPTQSARGPTPSVDSGVALTAIVGRGLLAEIEFTGLA